MTTMTLLGIVSCSFAVVDLFLFSCSLFGFLNNDDNDNGDNDNNDKQ